MAVPKVTGTCKIGEAIMILRKSCGEHPLRPIGAINGVLFFGGVPPAKNMNGGINWGQKQRICFPIRKRHEQLGL